MTPIVSHRELLSTGPSGIILSTDDYFAHKDGYHYDPSLLGAAHEWNQRRGIDSLQFNTSKATTVPLYCSGLHIHLTKSKIPRSIEYFKRMSHNINTLKKEPKAFTRSPKPL